MGDIDFVIEAIDQATKVLDGVKAKLGDTDAAGTSAASGIEKTNQALEKQAASAKKSESGLKSLVKSYTDVMNIVRNVAQVMKKAWEFAREGAELDYATIKFDRLAMSIDTTSDAMLKKLKAATLGTRSDMELMATAADFVGLGLAKTEDQVVRLSTVSAALGMDMNQLVLTLANQTTMRFDQLGVSIDGFDEKVKKLEESGLSASEAFTEAFLQQAEEQVDKVGNAADTTVGSFQRLEAAVENWTDAMKTATAQATAGFADEVATELTYLTKVTEVQSRLAEIGLDASKYMKQGFGRERTFDIEAAEMALGGVATNLNDIKQEFQGMPQDVFERIFGTLPEVQEDLQDTVIQLSDLAQAIQDTGGGEFKLNFLMDYAENYDTVQEKIKEKEAELAAARAAGWSETGSKVTGLKSDIDELYAGMDAAANKMVFDFAVAAAIADGIQPGEIEKIMGLGVEMGMWSEEAAGAAVTAWTTFTTEADTAMTTLSGDTETTWRTTTDNIIAMLDEIPDKVTVVVEQQGGGGGGGGGGNNSEWQGEGGNYASGGSFSGWGVVGDAPGGRWTPHTELVYAPHGARVYSAAQSRAMRRGGMPHFAEGGTIGGENFAAMFDRFIRANAIAVRDAVQQVMG
jgi:hypothetical protein